MEKVEKKQRKSNGKTRVEATKALLKRREDIGSRLALIQQLIPIGLMAVEELLQEEVTALAGARYTRNDKVNHRWGSNIGFVHLGGQKYTIQVPRVRNEQSEEEVPLRRYQALQSNLGVDDHVFAQVINGISARKFKKAAAQIPSAFGITKSSISRKFIKASAAKLKAFRDRALGSHDIIAIFMDGKSFAENEMIIALGVTS